MTTGILRSLTGWVESLFLRSPPLSQRNWGKEMGVSGKSLEGWQKDAGQKNSLTRPDAFGPTLNGCFSAFVQPSAQPSRGGSTVRLLDCSRLQITQPAPAVRRTDIFWPPSFCQLASARRRNRRDPRTDEGPGAGPAYLSGRTGIDSSSDQSLRPSGWQ